MSKSITSIRFEESVVLENDSLFIRSDKLPYHIWNNWNTVERILLEEIGKHSVHKHFGCEQLMGLNWFWVRKD